ncbi:hypothetical protein P691DRAFT_532767 [Macrolepiota fuliginosa MF-IS2]|uniref:Uncharacterized protein n=1 Tax=Macrolepiota fuliginosa MF-IS2 TaxID=1400762 RepID=A0A9P5XG85_9AGAR|nr:hypothetical protein P691DRAFT_532767 [Macrolepiota fuliginosa MF-IS2]
MALQSIQLISPVHVHTPTAHIGALYGSFAGQHVTALDASLFLQSIAVGPLDLHTVFSGLPLDTKARVRAAFYQRSAVSPSICDVAWERFISGKYAVGGPLGIDLLFGSSKVWGFEYFSLGGYSVVHLAEPDTISA